MLLDIQLEERGDRRAILDLYKPTSAMAHTLDHVACFIISVACRAPELLETVPRELGTSRVQATRVKYPGHRPT